MSSTTSLAAPALCHAVVKRSVVIAGHKTSVSLEDEFWAALKSIATAEKRTVSDLVAQIDNMRANANLSSALRLHVLRHLQNGGAR